MSLLLKKVRFLPRNNWFVTILYGFLGGADRLLLIFVGDISNSVIESVNKVGSLANGPILAMFLLGISLAMQ